MKVKRINARNFWSDIMFIDEIREIKRSRSLKDRKDYSDADITSMIAKHPIFQQLKKDLIEAQITDQIRIQMDSRRRR